MIDHGFGVERDVRSSADESRNAGLILRAVREGEDYSTKISPYDKSRFYTYGATLWRVIDGDTIIARVDLCFRTWIRQTFRLRGIDTPEITCAVGLKAKSEVKARLPLQSCVVIESYKKEKFDLFFADVFYLKGADDRERILSEGTFLNQELLDLRLAVPFML